ncbi:hypothetical protein PAXINDRAFT_17873 [Paxillus involutus ATCC 200175]|uniref:Nephrocystin 3-like N-terminal domain-containing protein n=1 Tax=Paxillus involutus ATCC 200175 TaxID=664439 RepID=A0A0C9SPJ2_PAXIN|nr:hypothetical protein PAXINDRAFT_17873 [Paxillus involutus ATCC 200175]
MDVDVQVTKWTAGNWSSYRTPQRCATGTGLVNRSGWDVPASLPSDSTTMDGLSAAATVIQLAQVAAQASIALTQYIAAVKGAESSRSKLIDQITLISAAAKAVESVMQNYPPSLRTPEQQALLKEWFRNDGRSAQCEKELKELASWLQGQVGNKKRVGWIRRLVWPVEENKIKTAIRSFEGHVPYFNAIVSVDNANLNQAIALGLTNDREETVKRKLLKWFDGVDCTVKHESTRELRQRTTGEWLLKEQLYIDWRKLSAKFLWLGGKAGAGKSVLACVALATLL